MPADGKYDTLVKQLASKLISSQAPERVEGAGLWGPVAINYPAFLRYFDREVKIRAEISRIESMVEKLPEDAAADRRRADQILRKLRNAQRELHQAIRVTAQQGLRLKDVTAQYRFKEDETIARYRSMSTTACCWTSARPRWPRRRWPS